MNEKIKLLARQACITIVSEPFDVASRSWNNNMEKFAELIVQECAEHLESSVLVPNMEHSRVKWKCIRAIKEHFGVK
jgi:hypothetical protein